MATGCAAEADRPNCQGMICEGAVRLPHAAGAAFRFVVHQP